jgi:hypothetical protein
VEKLKQRWEITKNWQLLFPMLGLLVLVYSSYKLAGLFPKNIHIAFFYALTAVIFFLLLKFVLFIFSKLERKWELTYKWEMISVFLVFASTGSSSIFISRPIMKLIGITKENLPSSVYWILYILIGFIFYQIMLVLIGWLFGQHQFFWNFEKKMLRRLGLKRLVD